MKYKVIILLLLICCLTGCTSNQVTIYQDYFDSYNTGELPSGWEIEYTGAGATKQGIFEYDGRSCLTIDGASNWSGVLKYEFDDLNDYVEVHFTGYNIDAPAGIMVGDGEIFAGSGMEEGWHVYRIEIDYNEGIRRVFIDDDFVAEDEMSNQGRGWSKPLGNDSAIVFDSSNTEDDCILYIDYLIVTTGNPKLEVQLAIYIVVFIILLLAIIIVLMLMRNDKNNQLAYKASNINPNIIKHAYLKGLTGEYYAFDLTLSKGNISFGRDPSQCQVVYPAKMDYISRKHCVLGYDYHKDSYYIMDCSTRGTYLNHHRVLKNQIRPLRNGDVIKIVDDRQSFRFEEG